MFKEVLSDGKLGFEKESLRVIQSKISLTPHQKKLGSALCNQYITTDFSEAQLELITPPLSDKTDGIKFLENLQHFISHNIEEEIIWPFSMPPMIESDKDIPIANYGVSNLGLFKRIYRNGLSFRYGRSMQAISGVHYNYSLSESIWEIAAKQSGKENIESVRTESYFSILRNLYRVNWLILYLFGASPILLKNFLVKGKDDFKKLDNQTYYFPYATSHGMSDYGYSNLTRSKLHVSTNSLGEYISDLQNATDTINHNYNWISNLKHKDKSQINTNILQIEDEYYAIARAKSKIKTNQRALSKLLQGGVDFIELRSLDINPFSRVGIDQETIYFLELLILYCFFEPSDPINEKESENISTNNLLVAKYGRDPDLHLQKENNRVSLREWGQEVFGKIMPIAELLDDESKMYSGIVNSMNIKLNKPDQTLSGKFLDKMSDGSTSFMDLGSSLGKKNKQYYLDIEKKHNPHWELFEKESKSSLLKQDQLEKDNKDSFDKFKSDYFKK